MKLTAISTILALLFFEAVAIEDPTTYAHNSATYYDSVAETPFFRGKGPAPEILVFLEKTTFHSEEKGIARIKIISTKSDYGIEYWLGPQAKMVNYQVRDEEGYFSSFNGGLFISSEPFSDLFKEENFHYLKAWEVVELEFEFVAPKEKGFYLAYL